MNSNIDIFIRRYTDLQSNQFIQDFYINNRIQCGLFLINDGKFELRTNINKEDFLDKLFNSARLLRFFYLNKEPTNINKWKNYFCKIQSSEMKKYSDKIEDLKISIKKFFKSECGFLDPKSTKKKKIIHFWNGYFYNNFIDEYFNSILFHSDQEKGKRLNFELETFGENISEHQIYQLIIILKSFYQIVQKIAELIFLKNETKSSYN